MAKEKKKKKKDDKGGLKTVEKQTPGIAPRLRDRYKSEVVDALMKEFSYDNVMRVPRLEKITVNMGLGKEALTNPNVIKAGQVELSTITGQKAVVTKAKKSISNFKLRAGMPVGTTVTLRAERMWEFLDRLIAVAMPRMRDFKGISGKAFDGRGNYSLGVREQIIFPEIDYDKVDAIRGMNITITTTARTDKEGKALLKQLGMPFRN